MQNAGLLESGNENINATVLNCGQLGSRGSPTKEEMEDEDDRLSLIHSPAVLMVMCYYWV